jgi:dihydroorotase
MTILIKQARIIDPNSPLNGQTVDLLIENGIISKSGKKPAVKPDQVIEQEGLCVSPGWVDVFADFADPGFEFKETLESGAAAAAAGGFTDVFVIPNTNPVIQNKGSVEYVINKSQSLPVTIYPLGAITKNAEGKELAEMYDMRASGAVAFTDGLHAVQSPGVMLKALQYVKAFDGTVIQLPDDKSINPNGLMNEGIVSTRLGLPGKPSIAEEIIVARDIKLTRYADSKIHFTGVSTAKSLEYIKRGKESKAAISCSVTPYHLYFTEDDMIGYDANLKLNPPLRNKADRDALKKSLASGEVDCIATHHLPHETDSKELEFEYAKFGMLGFETAFGVCNTAVPGISPELWVRLLSINARKIFNLNQASVQEGNKACLTLFNPLEKWTVEKKNLKSRSSNTPFIGIELTGKVIGIVNKGLLTLNN